MNDDKKRLEKCIGLFSFIVRTFMLAFPMVRVVF